jgi:uncharacterized protein DUF4190
MSRPQTEARAGTSYAPPAPQHTNRMAIWSLVLSILTLGGAGSIAGIWLGAAARRRIPQTGERGHGLAIAGIVVGVVTLIIAIAYWVVLAMHTGGGMSGGGGGGGGGGY